MDFFSFAKRVESEEEALSYAFELGLVSRTPPNCPLCSATMKWEKSTERRSVCGIWRCRRKLHPKKSLSLFHCSIFERFQIPISAFFKTVFFIAMDQTIEETVLNTKVSRPTVIRVHKMIRDMMCQFNRAHRKRIGGPGLVVEIDECHIHSRKNGVGRIEEGELWWVVGGICRQTREMFVVVVDYRNQGTLSKVIFENVEAGSLIYTDCWRCYNKVGQTNLNFEHKTVNHSQNFVSPDDPDVYTNTIERAWRTLRERLPLQTSLFKVESYVEKFLFFHHRQCKNTTARYNAIIDLCKLFYPVN